MASERRDHAVEHVIEVLANILGQKAQHERSMLLQQGVFSPIRASAQSADLPPSLRRVEFVCDFRGGALFFSEGMNEDAELLRRFVEQESETAFAELVSRRIGLVYAIAWRRTHDAHLAKEVTQSVFTALARKAPRLVGHQTLVGWLYRSARFAASNAVRVARRQQHRQEEIVTMQQLDRDTPEPDWQQLSPIVDDVLSEMTAVDRDAVLLRVVDECSYAEIGRGLGIGESGARMRVERTLEKMRRVLARRGMTSTAAALAIAIGQQAGAAVPGTLASAIASTAVAGAATAGGMFAILTFMSTTKMAMSTLGFVAIAAVITSVYQAQTQHRAESALALMTAERDQLRARKGADSLNYETSRSASPARIRSTVTSSAFESSPSSPSETWLRRAAWAATSAINVALESPAGKAAFVRQEVLRADDRFRRFFDEVQLSPQQRESIRREFQRYAEAKLDYYESVRAQGFGPMNPPQDPKVLLELLRMENQVDSAFAQNLRHVLGEEGARKFIDYRKIVPALNVIEQLAGRLYDTSEPLTPAQARGLVEVLQNNPYLERTETSSGSTLAGQAVPLDGAKGLSNLVHGDLMMPGLAWGAPITDAAIERTPGILGPRQVAALRELQAQQAASYQLAPPAAKGATPAEALALYRKGKTSN